MDLLRLFDDKIVIPNINTSRAMFNKASESIQ